jgi:hypothetical protein
MSCATHRLDGGIPMEVTIINADGLEIDRLVAGNALPGEKVIP